MAECGNQEDAAAELTRAYMTAFDGYLDSRLAVAREPGPDNALFDNILPGLRQRDREGVAMTAVVVDSAAPAAVTTDPGAGANRLLPGIENDERYVREFTLPYNEIARIQRYYLDEPMISMLIDRSFDAATGGGEVSVTRPEIADALSRDAEAKSMLGDLDALAPVAVAGLLHDAHRYLMIYGFCVMAIPRDPVEYLKAHARGDARRQLNPDPLSDAQARAAVGRYGKTAVDDNRPVSASLDMSGNWAVPVHVIDPADLRCDFEMYRSFDAKPGSYLHPVIATEKESGKLRHAAQDGNRDLRGLLLDNFRLVTFLAQDRCMHPCYDSGIGHARINTPLYRLHAEYNAICLLRREQVRACRDLVAPFYPIRFSAPDRSAAAAAALATPTEMAVNQRVRLHSTTAMQVYNEGGARVPPRPDEITLRAAEIGVSGVHPAAAAYYTNSVANALSSREARATNLRRRAAATTNVGGASVITGADTSDVTGYLPPPSTGLPAPVPPDPEELAMDVIQRTETGIYPLPPGLELEKHARAPSPLIQEIASLQNDYRHNLHKQLGIRTDATAPTVVANSAAAGSRSAIIDTRKGGSGKGDAAAPGSPEAVFVNPLAAISIRNQLIAFFEFAYREAYARVEFAHFAAVIQRIRRYRVFESMGALWQRVVDTYYEEALKHGNPSLANIIRGHADELKESDAVIKTLVHQRDFFDALDHLLRACVNAAYPPRLDFATADAR